MRHERRINFTLSFVDLAVPLSGLDIKIVRTYDSRDKAQGDFGVGWRLDVRQGSYRNNRPPGSGWQIRRGFLPCEQVAETRAGRRTMVPFVPFQTPTFWGGAPNGGRRWPTSPAIRPRRSWSADRPVGSMRFTEFLAT